MPRKGYRLPSRGRDDSDQFRELLYGEWAEEQQLLEAKRAKARNISVSVISILFQLSVISDSVSYRIETDKLSVGYPKELHFQWGSSRLNCPAFSYPLVMSTLDPTVYDPPF